MNHTNPCMWCRVLKPAHHMPAPPFRRRCDHLTRVPRGAPRVPPKLRHGLVRQFKHGSEDGQVGYLGERAHAPPRAWGQVDVRFVAFSSDPLKPTLHDGGLPCAQGCPPRGPLCSRGPLCTQLSDIKTGTKSFSAGTKGNTGFTCDPWGNCSTCDAAVNLEACAQVS